MRIVLHLTLNLNQLFMIDAVANKNLYHTKPNDEIGHLRTFKLGLLLTALHSDLLILSILKIR